MNYFPFHLGDYAAHTGHLEPIEDLAYRRMLDAYYLREGPLPADPAEVARLIRLRQHQAEVESVLREFFKKSEIDGCWHHSRCDEEIEHMQDRQEINAAKAEHESERMRRHRERRAELFSLLREKGCVPAWDAPMKELQRLLNAHATHLQREQAISDNAHATHLQREQAISDNAPATAIPIPIPIPTPIKKYTPKPPAQAPGAEERFEKFWKAYPRKVGKDGARKAFKKRNPDDSLVDEMIRSIAEQCRSVDWQKDGGQFIPHPATWLNQGRWQDGESVGLNGHSIGNFI